MNSDIMYEELSSILRKMSPSAPYDLMRTAKEKAEKMSGFSYTYPWWDVYPEGTTAAFVFRMAAWIGDGWLVVPDEVKRELNL